MRSRDRCGDRGRRGQLPASRSGAAASGKGRHVGVLPAPQRSRLSGSPPRGPTRIVMANGCFTDLCTRGKRSVRPARAAEIRYRLPPLSLSCEAAQFTLCGAPDAPADKTGSSRAVRVTSDDVCPCCDSATGRRAGPRYPGGRITIRDRSTDPREPRRVTGASRVVLNLWTGWGWIGQIVLNGAGQLINDESQCVVSAVQGRDPAVHDGRAARQVMSAESGVRPTVHGRAGVEKEEGLCPRRSRSGSCCVACGSRLV